MSSLSGEDPVGTHQEIHFETNTRLYREIRVFLIRCWENCLLSNTNPEGFSKGSISVLLKSPGYHFDVPVGENYLHLLSVQIIVYPP